MEGQPMTSSNNTNSNVTDNTVSNKATPAVHNVNPHGDLANSPKVDQVKMDFTTNRHSSIIIDLDEPPRARSFEEITATIDGTIIRGEDVFWLMAYAHVCNAERSNNQGSTLEE